MDFGNVISAIYLNTMYMRYIGIYPGQLAGMGATDKQEGCRIE